ncbi:T9SS type A sorting domain-containing protein [Hymenobacter jeollabukensis]|uniref:T9SS type A sorting domain-containing protein n=1 Tax=Hymenobacter jeollabukensis TaxID=2025313 RepID=A0A5R8WSJ4_9BACT|nr:T9SS type A sorting domain-containing protein [Hymenobacter jeollabukensis]TLM94132.1 T9SS type A sorting domain-containing protein [Hymenobacter jeollabukensis]
MKHLVSLLTNAANYLLLGVATGLAGPAFEAAAQTPPDPYYSKFATPTAPDQYSVQRNGVLCVGCGVANPDRAADNTLTNYATVQQSVGAGNRAAVRLSLNGAAPALYRVGVVVSNGTTLNASALGAIVLRTYRNGALQDTRLASAAGVTATTLADGRTQLDFISQYAVDQLEVEATIVLNVLNTLDVYYAYAVPANVVTTATGYLSRLTAASASDYVATASGGLACLNSGVINPLNAVTPSLTDNATLHVTGVGCKTALQVKLEGSAPAGYQAGFVIGSSSLLDLNVLSSLKVKTYKDGVLQETGSAANLLDLKLLPDGKYQVSFRAGQPFDHVELEKTGVLGLLDDLQVYYGFGIEPRAFADQEPILSDFAAGQTSGNYQTGGNCPSCISNPERAADASLSNYAQINFPTVSLGGSQRLRLRVNGDANAGNRAGVAMSFNNGLLSTSLLSNVTLRTYAADGTFLESASGSSLLSTGLLGGNAQEIGFMTTQDFEWVEVEINNGIGLGSNAQIYYAFADDPVQGFPSSITPPTVLPVELRAFQAKAAGSAVELSWETAMEKNSRYFAVERATVADGRFAEIGRVPAAGNSTSLRRYATRDAEAARLAAGTLYYRLRQVDTDGTASYSDVQAVRWQPKADVALTLYPNPASDAASVQLSTGLPAEGSVLYLYTTRGQLVRRQALTPKSASLALKGLPAGLYQVVLLNAQGQRVANERLSVVH